MKLKEKKGKRGAFAYTKARTSNRGDKESYTHFTGKLCINLWCISSVFSHIKVFSQKMCGVNWPPCIHVAPTLVFLLHVTKLIIDSIMRYKILSFIDCIVRYDQIKMKLEDQEATTVRTLKHISYYQVMPFGLKNGGGHIPKAKGWCKLSLRICCINQYNIMLMI